MAPPIILFFFDYIDPLSWVMENRLRLLGQIEHIPLELAPPGAPLPLTSDPAWRARTEEAAAAAAADGLEYEPAQFVPHSRKAVELAFLAAERQAFDRVHRMLFEAHLCRGLDIGRVDVLVELAVKAGLDRTETKAVLDVDRHSADVEAWRTRAISLGAATAPTIMIGGRLFEGLVAPPELGAALEDV